MLPPVPVADFTAGAVSPAYYQALSVWRHAATLAALPPMPQLKDFECHDRVHVHVQPVHVQQFALAMQCWKEVVLALGGKS